MIYKQFAQEQLQGRLDAEARTLLLATHVDQQAGYASMLHLEHIAIHMPHPMSGPFGPQWQWYFSLSGCCKKRCGEMLWIVPQLYIG